jgi:hypothetical protein
MERRRSLFARVLFALSIGCAISACESEPSRLIGQPPDDSWVPDSYRALPELAPDPAIADHVLAVMEAEQTLEVLPPVTIAYLRQLFYGAEWSTRSSSSIWSLVIPCSPELDDPRKALGEKAFNELAMSADTPTHDLAHLYPVLEAAICPQPEVLGVKMRNEDFAGWAGDIGSAVAARAACLALGDAAMTDPGCGNVAAGQPLAFYIDLFAGRPDLEADFDALVIRVGALKRSCAGSAGVPLTFERRLDDTLLDFYVYPDSPLGLLRRGRNRCALEVLGGTLKEGELENRDELIDVWTPQILSFANVYYFKLLNANPTDAELDAMRIDAKESVTIVIDQLRADPATLK